MALILSNHRIKEFHPKPPYKRIEYRTIFFGLHAPPNRVIRQCHSMHVAYASSTESATWRWMKPFGLVRTSELHWFHIDYQTAKFSSNNSQRRGICDQSLNQELKFLIDITGKPWLSFDQEPKNVELHVCLSDSHWSIRSGCQSALQKPPWRQSKVFVFFWRSEVSRSYSGQQTNKQVDRVWLGDRWSFVKDVSESERMSFAKPFRRSNFFFTRTRADRVRI